MLYLIDKNNVFAWYNKACFTVRLGRIEEALKYLKKALELDRSLINVVMDDEDLAPLRSNKKFQQLIKSFKQNHV